MKQCIQVSQLSEILTCGSLKEAVHMAFTQVFTQAMENDNKINRHVREEETSSKTKHKLHSPGAKKCK